LLTIKHTNLTQNTAGIAIATLAAIVNPALPSWVDFIWRYLIFS